MTARTISWAIIGALVDSVQEVVELDPDVIEPAPRIGGHLRTEFTKGMGKRDNHFIIILDAAKILSTKELAVMTESGNGPSEGTRAANE